MSADLYYSLKLRAGAVEYEIAHDVEAFTLDEEATRPSQLEVTLGDPFHVLSHAVREGMEVEVDLGHRSEHSVAFRGRIYRVEGDFPAEAVPTLRFIALDERMRMGLRQRSRRFDGMSLRKVVQTVAGAYFARVEVDITGNPDFGENGVRQMEQTDLEFLLALADEFECEMVLVDDGHGNELRYVSSSRLRQAAPRQSFYYARSGVSHLLTSFRPRVDVSRVRLPRAQAAVDGDTGDEVGVFERPMSRPLEIRDALFDDNLARLAQHDRDRSIRLQALAAAAEEAAASLSQEIGRVSVGSAWPFLTENQRAEWQDIEVARGLLGMEAQASLDGLHGVRAASVIRVENVGARFSGNWYLRKVRHLLDRSGGRTELECER